MPTRGVTYTFHYKSPKEVGKMLNFSIKSKIKSKHKNLKSDAKMSDSDDGDKIFEQQSILPLFF